MKNNVSIAVLSGCFIFSLAAFGRAAQAQEGTVVATQTLVAVDAKSKPPASASQITVSVNGHKEPLTAWKPLDPANTQIALLIDDGLRERVGRELVDLRTFILTLPPGMEIMVGYMQYGHVLTAQAFTLDHVHAAATIRLPAGIVDMTESPYFCLSDFVDKWPSASEPSHGSAAATPTAQHKARFVLMLTNGVDPYGGSYVNEVSPYVEDAIEDAQRAGVMVYSIYFADAGIRLRIQDFSGQDYLNRLTQATGGVDYYEGMGNPVMIGPFLTMFQHAVAETYVATFNAPTTRDPKRDMVLVKFTAAKIKFNATQQLRPGNVE